MLAVNPLGDNIPVLNDADPLRPLQQQNASVARAPGGSFVVVWQHESGELEADGSSPDTDIYFRVFHPDGSPRTAATLVAGSTRDEEMPRVGIADNGDFVIVWQEWDRNDPGDDWDIFFQRFHINGTPQDDENEPQRVNATVNGHQSHPDVHVYSDGDFVVTWQHETVPDEGEYDIRFRRYNASGSEIDGSDRIVVESVLNEQYPRVAGGRSGTAATFAVGWVEATDVYFRLFNRGLDATAITPAKVLVSDMGDGEVIGSGQHDLAMDDADRLAIVFAERFEADEVEDWNLYLRRYDDLGVPLTVGYQVIDDSSDNTLSPSVARTGAGALVVVNEVYASEGDVDARDIQVWRLSAVGVIETGPESPLSPSREPGDQRRPHVDVNDLGELVVVWDDDFPQPLSPDARDVLARNYREQIEDVNDGRADIIGRSSLGNWLLTAANSQGNGSTNVAWGQWSTAVTWDDVLIGDFNGDGRDDVIGRDSATGDWWVALTRSDGSGSDNVLWGKWSPSVTWVDVVVGDFNDDGKADVVGRVESSGEWWMLESIGGGGSVNVFWGRWSTSPTWVDVMVGDFNGDNRADVIGRVESSGEWWLLRSQGGSADNVFWGRWSTHVTWDDVMVADFNNDGRDDVIGRVASSGEWWLLNSSLNGNSLNQFWGRWSTDVSWHEVHVGYFHNQQHPDVIGRVSSTGEWWMMQTNQTGTGGINSYWGKWSTAVTWHNVLVADFNDDGRADVVGRVASTNEWYLMRSNAVGDPSTNLLWGIWPLGVTWADVGVALFR